MTCPSRCLMECCYLYQQWNADNTGLDESDGMQEGGSPEEEGGWREGRRKGKGRGGRGANCCCFFAATVIAPIYDENSISFLRKHQ